MVVDRLDLTGLLRQQTPPNMRQSVANILDFLQADSGHKQIVYAGYTLDSENMYYVLASTGAFS